MFGHNCSIFVHDGDPCHRSRAVKQFLEQKTVRELDWPGNSPNLNPIENLWNLISESCRKVSVKFKRTSTSNQRRLDERVVIRILLLPHQQYATSHASSTVIKN